MPTCLRSLDPIQQYQEEGKSFNHIPNMATTHHRRPATPRYVTSHDSFVRDSKGQTIVDSDTIWDILRANLLWFNNENFHLGAALLNAWRATIYIGMEVEQDIDKYPRKPERTASMRAKFNSIWMQGNFFAQ
jgi:hypothetical protein